MRLFLSPNEQPTGDRRKHPESGIINAEPMALATGVDNATVCKVAPEASVTGSSNTTLSSSDPQAILKWEESLIHGNPSSQTAGEELDEGFSTWEFDRICVVLGRGSKTSEANLELCVEDRVPIVRRCSGGASIVAGPGCLMYSVILSLDKRPDLRSIDAAHRFVMDRIRLATWRLDFRVTLQGICDLTIEDRKFSGNALRYTRDWLLYHGTILYRFPIESISRYLATPPRQPAYRSGRSHADFLTNLECKPEALKQSLREAWGLKQ
ncbi:MAG: lipoate--protein ligase family protein [Planctomycetota bacterium]|nr:lipoate--protein ligase family protein [Planctomycetota bacterium]